MNQEIRKLLIERARINIPISYGTIMQQLDLDNSRADHREILSNELADISRFEKTKGRPMISSMAMYEGGQLTGPRFYELAEELGHGSARVLKKRTLLRSCSREAITFG